jgi:hypothetical protein
VLRRIEIGFAGAQADQIAAGGLPGQGQHRWEMASRQPCDWKLVDSLACPQETDAKTQDDGTSNNRSAQYLN